MRKFFICNAIVICLVALNGYAQIPNEPNSTKDLERELEKIAATNNGGRTGYAKLETDCLALINDHNSPEDMGKIYAKLAFIYSGKGWSSQNDIRRSKTIDYCEKALKYPLDTITICDTYARLADSKMFEFYRLPKNDLAKVRREAIVECLIALKIVLDNNAPKEWKEPPPGGGFYNRDGEPNDPAFQKAIQEARQTQEQQRATRRKWEFEEKLYFLRQTLFDKCIELYSHKPYNSAELEKLARDNLKGHDDAINELMAKVSMRIQEK